ncbi:hypothetical protein PFICI_04721 [Pestalotiopsis fici W106-1]|uniref:Uncharacterized protein n=1 Tax=Pestalotiopsis fici (strain W106-1 / CGMCC3.15140) TaxID=1229662 RepID=W3X9W3_PESFW|nr:uncharacterized protein PFICI_04721 [Pestalotiopsis fici W106-1]ETS82845.1 hypothetical protein PFICI_04721 [Pestalotiopsis fici W106-1]
MNNPSHPQSSTTAGRRRIMTQADRINLLAFCLVDIHISTNKSIDMTALKEFFPERYIQDLYRVIFDTCQHLGPQAPASPLAPASFGFPESWYQSPRAAGRDPRECLRDILKGPVVKDLRPRSGLPYVTLESFSQILRDKKPADQRGSGLGQAGPVTQHASVLRQPDTAGPVSQPASIPRQPDAAGPVSQPASVPGQPDTASQKGPEKKLGYLDAHFEELDRQFRAYGYPGSAHGQVSSAARPGSVFQQPHQGAQCEPTFGSSHVGAQHGLANGYQPIDQASQVTKPFHETVT